MKCRRGRAMDRQCAGSPKCSRLGNPRNRDMCYLHYEQYLRGLRAAGWRGHVSAVPVVARVHALLDAGWTRRRISAAAGVNEHTIWFLESRRQVWCTTSDAIMNIPIWGAAVGEENGHVPAVGTRRRLRSLEALGYSRTEIATRIGRSMKSLSDIMNTDDAPGVYMATANRVDAIWRELQLRPPPVGATANRARNRAEARGWPPPMAWDEDAIDDPAAAPYGQRGERVDWYPEYLDLLDMGLTGRSAAARLGVQWATVEARVRRYAKEAAA